VTVAGLRRSDGVEDDSVSFPIQRGAQRPVLNRAGAQLFERGHGQLAGCDPDDIGEDSSGRGDQQRTAEMCRVRLRDGKSSSVQNARYETPTSQVAVRPLRTQLRSPVRLLSSLSARCSHGPSYPRLGLGLVVKGWSYGYAMVAFGYDRPFCYSLGFYLQFQRKQCSPH